MEIKDIFVRPIDRSLEGVIKADALDDATVKQELDEYVVTDELKKHFAKFFHAYADSIGKDTKKMGVWISGFFGSGKSHFLKSFPTFWKIGKSTDATPWTFLTPTGKSATPW